MARTEWKKQDIPKFIEEMYGIVEGEQLERCRSIRGMGDYTLDEIFVHHYAGKKLNQAIRKRAERSRSRTPHVSLVVVEVYPQSKATTSFLVKHVDFFS
jgi:hypothetical protein